VTGLALLLCGLCVLGLALFPLVRRSLVDFRLRSRHNFSGQLFEPLGGFFAFPQFSFLGHELLRDTLLDQVHDFVERGIILHFCRDKDISLSIKRLDETLLLVHPAKECHINSDSNITVVNLVDYISRVAPHGEKCSQTVDRLARHYTEAIDGQAADINTSGVFQIALCKNARGRCIGMILNRELDFNRVTSCRDLFACFAGNDNHSDTGDVYIKRRHTCRFQPFLGNLVGLAGVLQPLLDSVQIFLSKFDVLLTQLGIPLGNLNTFVGQFQTSSTDLDALFGRIGSIGSSVRRFFTSVGRNFHLLKLQKVNDSNSYRDERESGINDDLRMRPSIVTRTSCLWFIPGFLSCWFAMGWGCRLDDFPLWQRLLGVLLGLVLAALFVGLAFHAFYTVCPAC
jgi:hypothetical protein